MIGAAFDNWMIVPDWKTGQTPRAEATLAKLADHVDHICQLAGTHRHVAIGTDLDGGYGSEQSPIEVETIADVQKFADVLDERGYASSAIDDYLSRKLAAILSRASAAEELITIPVDRISRTTDTLPHPRTIYHAAQPR